MTKLRNKLVIMLLALCLVTCAGLIVACGGEKSNNKSVTYTVTVKADDAAVKGVKVTVKKGTASFGSKTTGDDGKVSFSLAKDNYTVTLSNLPEGYEAPASDVSFPSDRNLTVNLVEKFAYKINLVNAADNTPFYAEGVTVGICKATDGNCLNPVDINANGLAKVYDAEKTDYHIQVLGLPLGYAYESDLNGYSLHQSVNGSYMPEDGEDLYNSLSATVTEKTVKIYQVKALELDKMTALTQAQIDEYSEEKYIDINGGAAYKVTAKIPAESTVYYSFTSAYNGKYTLYAVDLYATDHWYQANSSFLLGDYSMDEVPFNYSPHSFATQKDKKYYINITNKESNEIDVEFVLATPVATTAKVTGASTVDLTVFNAQANAVIQLTPAAGAAFKVTAEGAKTAVRAYMYAESAEAMWQELDDADYTANASIEFKFTEDLMKNVYTKNVYLGIAVQADSYPATVKVKIEKIADVKNTITRYEATATLTQYTVPSGKELVSLPYSSVANLVKGADGYYHVGAENGPIVVVKLKGDLDTGKYSFGGELIYMELANPMAWISPYLVDVTSAADKENLTKGNSYIDYSWVLRGFDEYKYDERNNPSIPTVTYDKYYAKYANTDGVYPLNDELKNILKALIGQMINDGNDWLFPYDVNEEDWWAFACYSYEEYLEPDVIAGDYKFVKYADKWGEVTKVGDKKMIDWDMELGAIYGAVADDEYKLTVDKRGTFTIYQLDGGDYTAVWDIGSGVWTKEGDTYTFTVPNMMIWDDENSEYKYEDFIYTVTFNATIGRLTLGNEDGTLWVFQKGGAADLVNVFEDENGQVMLEVYDNDTFKLYVDNNYVAGGTYVANSEFDVRVTVTDKAQSVTTVEITYNSGMFLVTVDEQQYSVDTGMLYLLTDDGNAKLEVNNVDSSLTLYIKDGENWKKIVYSVPDMEGEEGWIIVESDDSVESVEIDAGEGDTITISVTYTDNTTKNYEFSMEDVL